MRFSRSTIFLAVTIFALAAQQVQAIASVVAGTVQATPAPLPASLANRSNAAAIATHPLSFEETMNRLSEKTHCTIIAEGMPLTAVRNDVDVALGEARDAATALEAITHAADAFDYDAERVNSHLILLRKRYSDENDLPCITFEEMQHSLSAVLQLNSAYSDAGRYGNGIRDSDKLYHSLTDDQLKRAVDGIPAKELSGEQRSLTNSVAGFWLITRRASLLGQALDRLTYLKSPQNTFQWLTLPNMPSEVFGFREQYDARGFILNCPLSNEFRLLTGGYAYVSNNSATLPADGKATPNRVADSGPTTPREVDRRLASGMLANRLPSTQTLDELVQAWSAGKLGNGDSDGVQGATGTPQADVKAGLGEKPVCLFGGEYSRAEQQIRAVATLYGLELLVPKQGEYHLIMPIPASPKTADDYPHEIERLIPPSLLRQYTGLTASADKGLAAKEDKQAAAADASTVSPAQRAANESSAAMQRVFASQSAANFGGYYPAVRRLIVLAKPLVPTPTSPPVRLTDANPEVLRLIALLFYSADGCRKQVEDLISKPVPECVFHPDELIFKVKPFNNGMGATWEFGNLDANGAFHRENFFSEPLLPSKK